MPHLLLRGQPLGCFDGSATALGAVLFDKDGTLSHSEPMLLRLARARIRRCLALANHPGDGRAETGSDRAGETAAGALSAEEQARLRELLEKAYGIDELGVHPAGITAVAARDHNLLATATALAQVGLGWPDALSIAEAAFNDSDGSVEPEHQPVPTAGLAPLLDRLSEAGLVCAVISNDHIEGIQTFLERHDLGHRFAGLWSAEHHPRKPSAGAVQGLCRELGIPPSRCALIGDAASDLRMGRAAGVPVLLGYRSGWGRRPRLDPGTLCLEHWDELDAMPH